MRKMIRYIRDNFKKILIIVGVIAFILVVIKMADQIAKNELKNKANQKTNTVDKNVPNYSIMDDTHISEKITQDNTQIIQNFIEACNKKEYEAAYNLLSSDCKKLLFPDQNIFIQNYVNNVFGQVRDYHLNAWTIQDDLLYAYTYQVNFHNDILSSGKLEQKNAIQDYYTIVKEDKEFKLNINSYIGHKAYSQKSSSSNNITIEITGKDVYKDYEKYNIKITNDSKKTILLDSKETLKTIYLEDQNETKYMAYIEEFTEEELKIIPGLSRQMNIKFNKICTNSKDIKNVNFTNIIVDYDGYKANGKEKAQKISIRIKIR